MSNTIFLICGESGCGKTTIVNELEKKYYLTSINSYTTRPPRSENEKGHIFVSDKEFDKLENICAYTERFEGRYCVTEQQIEDSDIYVVDKAGIEYFKQHYKGDKNYKVIYIKTIEVDRYIRMSKRQNTDIALRRIEEDKLAFSGIENLADFTIQNNNRHNLETVVEKIYQYIERNV